ncbi:MAG: hypothetical protein NZ740_09985 [Kiritimatiellae bacterium]|nr:hypothetical protein [Kiritimatiellia bacterium]MDW8459422.1 hypothetical protein [Verrucomicrobiota bacterium]
MKAPSPVVYYITSHGFGHGARSCDILRAVREADAEVPLIVVSDLPAPFLEARLGGLRCAFRRARFDVGMVQIDSVRVDVPATLAACVEWLRRADAVLAEERRFLRESGAAAVVCDIPSIPLEAAALEGIPALAAGNFGWDWIYEEFVSRDPAWAEIVARFRRGYSLSSLLMRMPFAEPMAAFPRRVEIGVTARPGTPRRRELASLTGADPSKRWVLLSFAELAWEEAALRAVSRLVDWEFFTVLPLRWDGPNFRAVDRRAVSYADVLASCDAVLTKPGFGVLSDCAVNGKPIIYVERTDFREYPILEAAVRQYYRSVHLPAEQLYRGDLRSALEAIETAPEPVARVATGGDRAAAEIILKTAGQG